MSNCIALLRGAARENDAIDEARAELSCSMGVGCNVAGVCYAKAHGVPELCPCAPAIADCPDCDGTGISKSCGYACDCRLFYTGDVK